MMSHSPYGLNMLSVLLTWMHPVRKALEERLVPVQKSRTIFLHVEFFIYIFIYSHVSREGWMEGQIDNV